MLLGYRDKKRKLALIVKEGQCAIWIMLDRLALYQSLLSPRGFLIMSVA